MHKCKYILKSISQLKLKCKAVKCDKNKCFLLICIKRGHGNGECFTVNIKYLQQLSWSHFSHKTASTVGQKSQGRFRMTPCGNTAPVQLVLS